MPSAFPFSGWQGRICASAAAGAGTGQLWSSAGFLLMELRTVPGPLSRGNALIGMRPEERHPSLCRSMQGWIALSQICTPNPFPETRETFSALPPVPGVCSSLVLSSCSVSWSFWALLLHKSLGSCPCRGTMALWGSTVSPLRSREMFPPPQPKLLGTGHFRGDWLFSSM